METLTIILCLMAAIVLIAVSYFTGSFVTNRKWKKALQEAKRIIEEDNYIIPKVEIEKFRKVFFPEEDI